MCSTGPGCMYKHSRLTDNLTAQECTCSVAATNYRIMGTTHISLYVVFHRETKIRPRQKKGKYTVQVFTGICVCACVCVCVCVYYVCVCVCMCVCVCVCV